MRGRKPIPDEVKALRGNPGKRRLRAAPSPGGTPKCPAHVAADKEAKAEWKRLAQELKGLNLLASAYRPSMAAYCLAWSRWVKAETFVRQMGAVLYRTTPEGEVILESAYQNPQLFVANRAMEQLTRLLAEFGLTPSSRSRVAAPPAAPEADPMEILLNGGQSRN